MGHAEGPSDSLYRITLRSSVPPSGYQSRPETRGPLAHLVLHVLWSKSRHLTYGRGHLHEQLSQQRLELMDIKGKIVCGARRRYGCRDDLILTIQLCTAIVH